MSESPHSNQWDLVGTPLDLTGFPRDTPGFLWDTHMVSPQKAGNPTFSRGFSLATIQQNILQGQKSLDLRDTKNSATHGDLLVPRTRTVTYGPRSCAVSTVSGMTCHRPCVHYPAHSDSFKAHWKQHCFVQHIRKMIWQFRDCLGRHNSAI